MADEASKENDRVEYAQAIRNMTGNGSPKAHPANVVMPHEAVMENYVTSRRVLNKPDIKPRRPRIDMWKPGGVLQFG